MMTKSTLTLILLFIFIIPFHNSHAKIKSELSCETMFAQSQNLTPELTRKQKPRYFSVKDYDQYNGTAFKEFINGLKTFNDYLSNSIEIDAWLESYMNGSRRGAQRYVANKITPLVEDFLKEQKIKYTIEMVRDDENGEVDSFFVIEQTSPQDLKEGTYSALNRLAHDMAGPKYALIVDPFDLVRKNNGSVKLNTDGVTYYSVSLNLFANIAVQHKMFQFEGMGLESDPELEEFIAPSKENKNESISFADYMTRRDDQLAERRLTPRPQSRASYKQ